MTKRSDFEEVIRKRLESLGKKPKTPEKPVDSPEGSLDSTEGVDKGKANKRLKKKREKHMNGYVNRKGRRSG